MRSIKRVNGMPAEDAAALNRESFEMLRQVRSIEFVMKTGKRGDPIFGNMYCVMTVDNSQRVLDLQEKFIEHTNKRLQDAKQGVVKSTTAKRLEIAGKPALQQEVHFDLSNIPGAEANHAVFDEMLGVGGTMVGYFAAADEHTVLVGLGVSQDAWPRPWTCSSNRKRAWPKTPIFPSPLPCSPPVRSGWPTSVRGVSCN